MRQIVTMVLLLVGLCPSMAQENADECVDTIHSASHNLEEIVVSGVAGNVSYNNSSAPVIIVKSQELHNTMSTNLIDAISRKAGVSQITTGAGISKPVIRGLGYNRLVVVNNGMRQEGQQWGDEHGIEIDDSEVGSVEILKGPASLMYGSDAMAGVIVFRESPIPNDKLEGTISAEYQTNNGLAGTSGRLRGRSGNLFWSANAGLHAAHNFRVPREGYIDGSAFRQAALSGELGLIGDWGVSRLQATYFYLKPGMIEGDEEEEEERNEQQAENAGASYSISLPFQKISHLSVTSNSNFNIGKGSLRAIIGYQRNDRQEFEESAAVPGLHMILNTFNYNVHHQTFNTLGNIRFGISGMWQGSQNRGNEFLIPDYQLLDIGVFGAFQADYKRLSINFGMRADLRHLQSHALVDDGEQRFNKFSRNFTAATGSLGAVWHMGSAGNLRLNLARGYRAPNISELASNGVHEGTQHYEIGNQNLKAEHSTQCDLGYEYLGSRVHCGISLFFNDVENFIYLRSDGEFDEEGMSVFRFDQRHARLMGGEAFLDIHPIKHIHFENTFSYVYSRLLHQTEDARYLPFTPAPRITSELRFDILHLHQKPKQSVQNLWASANVEYSLRQSHCYTANGTETPTDAYAILGGSIGLDLHSGSRHLFTIVLNAHNILNKRYFNHLSRLKYIGDGIPEMGRNIGLKIVYNI